MHKIIFPTQKLWIRRLCSDTRAGMPLLMMVQEIMYGVTGLEETNMTMPNGAKASLYSAYKYGTVDLHFKWLKEHNLDGVFQQRFISDIRSGGGKKHFNQVVRNVQKASEKYKRVYCIMYDITGAGPNWKETLM